MMSKLTTASVEIRVADEVWIAVALLHREQPTALDFSLAEIEARLRREGIAGEVRKGVYPHLSLHCVANRPPNPGRYRMLFETGPSRRRLYRAGDAYDPAREGAKTTPRRGDIPGKYHALIDWYEREWTSASQSDPLLELSSQYGSLWKGTDADEYVRRLREEWS